MHKRRILVIDDAEEIHKDFTRILCPKPSGDWDDLALLEATLFGSAPAAGESTSALFELDSAFQGQEGLAKVQEAMASGRPYELVFLDYRMPPGWNGFETLRRLRQVAPSVPVVLCSAYSDYSWEQISRELGGEQPLTELRKPFDKQELHQLARTLTEPRVTSEGGPHG
jgi:CheY-like chemotaxis protein